jgi:hypothetical protein
MTGDVVQFTFDDFECWAHLAYFFSLPWWIACPLGTFSIVLAP